ncbi:MAG: hypothetical protein WC253_05715 [Sulfurovaceae bacterium]|nr:hypothetical protein [Sulfurovaceae bacterium]
MNNKQFTIFTIYGVFVILAAAAIINTLDFSTQKNDVLRKYQFSKFDNKDINKDINTVFIGDSSCGNAINANLFNANTGLNSYNLALTGSFGVESDINMLKHSLKHFPKLQNVIFMHTLNIWGRDFSYTGYFDTLYSFSDLFNYNYFTDKNLFTEYLIYKTNPKEIGWLLGKNKIKNSINLDIDYNEQKNKKFSNGLIALSSVKNYDEFNLANHKKLVYQELEHICKKNNLKCFYVNGPILENIYEDEKHKVDKLIKKINSLNKDIIFIPNVFAYSSNIIGDSEDHIDPDFKDKVTLDYMEILKKYGLKGNK